MDLGASEEGKGAALVNKLDASRAGSISVKLTVRHDDPPLACWSKLSLWDMCLR